MQETLEFLAGEFDELKEKITAIQDNEALVFATNDIIEEQSHLNKIEIAQDGDGAEE